MAEPYILFQIASSTYAVPAIEVQHVDMVERITFVPHAPSFIQGVAYLRGQVLPVINVRRRFNLEEQPVDLRSRLIVVKMGERLAGLLVDAAREFIRLDPEAIANLPADLTGPGREYLQGVITLPDRLVLVVDLQQLLNPAEKDALSTPLETSGEPNAGQTRKER